MNRRKQAIVEVDTVEFSASLSSGALPLHVSPSVNEAKSFVYPDDDDNKRSKHKFQFLQDIPRSLRVVNKYAVMLNLVTIIWGSQHVVIKWVISDEHSNVDPATFSLIRFSIATFFSAPFTPLPSKCPVSGVPARVIWRWGFEMGIWMFLGFALQTVGLQFTSASRSAFLLYLNVKFVPFLGWFVLGKRIRRIALASAMLALLGTFLLFSSNNSHDAANIGDLWSILAAVVSAMFILRMEAAMEHVTKGNGAALSAASLWTVTVLNCCWAYLYSQDNIVNTVWSVLVDIQGSIGYTWKVGNICALVYLGGVCTSLTNYIQAICQSSKDGGVSAERASIIYAMDPVWGALFASCVLGEALGIRGYAGAGLIVLAAVSSAVFDGKSNHHFTDKKLSEDTDIIQSNNV